MSDLLVRHQVMKRFFVVSILAVTFAPSILVFMFLNNLGGFEVTILYFLGLRLAASHVPMTFYLLMDKDIRSRCRDDFANSVIIPLGLFVVSLIAVISAPLYVTLIFIILYFHYQAWHFGSQNIGICSLFSTSILNRPITSSERRTVKISTIGGMMGTLATFQNSNFTLDTNVFPFDFSGWIPISNILFYMGATVTACSMAYALYLIVTTRLYVNPVNCLIYIAGVIFFVPIFIFNEVLLIFMTYTIAHGLQYVLILFFHSLTNMQTLKVDAGRKLIWRCSLPIVVFTVFCISLMTIWAYRYSYGDRIETLISWFVSYIKSGENAVRISMAIAFGVSLAHFWFDQNLWKFRTPQTANWMKSRFPFLFGQLSSIQSPQSARP